MSDEEIVDGVETPLGQHMRWMRQAPDLYERLQAERDEAQEALRRAHAEMFELVGERDALRQALAVPVASAEVHADEPDELGRFWRRWLDEVRPLLRKDQEGTR